MRLFRLTDFASTELSLLSRSPCQSDQQHLQGASSYTDFGLKRLGIRNGSLKRTELQLDARPNRIRAILVAFSVHHRQPLFIGIVISSMERARQEEAALARKQGQTQRAFVLEHLNDIRNALDEIEGEVERTESKAR